MIKMMNEGSMTVYILLSKDLDNEVVSVEGVYATFELADQAYKDRLNDEAYTERVAFKVVSQEVQGV